MDHRDTGNYFSRHSSHPIKILFAGSRSLQAALFAKATKAFGYHCKTQVLPSIFQHSNISEMFKPRKHLK